MKKLSFVVIGIACVISFSSCNNSKNDVGELVKLRNKYQNEYEILDATLKLRAFEQDIEEEYRNLTATFDEFQRMKVCSDSIEILNIEIEKL